MNKPSKPFLHQRVLVTGASSGIGFAVAQALALAGADIHGVARKWQQAPPTWHTHCADLSVESDVKRLAQELQQESKPLNIVVHSAGAFAAGPLADFDINELDKLFAINVRAPFLLTQLLLPQLVQTHGQIVFINSSAGITSKQGLSGYSATKFAIKSIADALRQEVNAEGVRVMSVYPGKTASPMQEQAHKLLGQAYNPSNLMQASDVAQAVLAALTLPPSAEMTDLHIRPMQK
ncbi:MAG TPA: SDR family NAD(P)-dependent oxidoreductase [Burkholderiaceae bacterium]|nr:SDR family NAD(P)-dependent oxidoreductase [Burkholderiaceae bacterium]